jgi:hypothetical protein
MRRLVGFADERVVRIDAGGARIARPRAEASVHELRGALEALGDFTVESVFVEGPDGNANETDIDAYRPIARRPRWRRLSRSLTRSRHPISACRTPSRPKPSSLNRSRSAQLWHPPLRPFRSLTQSI